MIPLPDSFPDTKFTSHPHERIGNVSRECLATLWSVMRSCASCLEILDRYYLDLHICILLMREGQTQVKVDQFALREILHKHKAFYM